jgi:hypothetical protein
MASLALSAGSYGNRIREVGVVGADAERRLAALSAKGDPLEMITRVVPFESFRAEIEAAVQTKVSEKKAPLAAT